MIHPPSFPTRREVEYANNKRLDRIDSELFIFNSLDMAGNIASFSCISPDGMSRLLDRVIAAKKVRLKVGICSVYH